MAENIVLGRGRVFFAPYYPNVPSGGVKGYLGNTPELTMAANTQKLDHYSSEQGIKVKDRSVILQEDITLTFSTDNISVANLMLWFGGKNSGTLPTDAPSAAFGSLAFIGSAQQIFGSLFFESDNPVGSNVNYWFPYVSISPNGNFALKGDTWQTLSFSGEALKRDVSTERLYGFVPTGGVSTATADATHYLAPEDVGLATGGDTVATSTTVTTAGSGVHGTSQAVSYVNTAGTVSWLSFHNGTNNVGTIAAATGASGSEALTPPAAGTYTVKAYGAPDGSGTALGTSSSITVT